MDDWDWAWWRYNVEVELDIDLVWDGDDNWIVYDLKKWEWVTLWEEVVKVLFVWEATDSQFRKSSTEELEDFFGVNRINIHSCDRKQFWGWVFFQKQMFHQIDSAEKRC